MARQTFQLTDTYQKIASGIATITIQKRGKGSIFFNETATDADAYHFRPLKISEQYQQNATEDTFMRSSDPTGWEVLVDGVL